MSNEKQEQSNKEDEQTEKAIFAEKLLLGFNEYDEIIGRCKGVSIFSVDFGDKNDYSHEGEAIVPNNDATTKDNEERKKKLIKNAFYAEEMDVLFDEIFKGKRDYGNAFNYKNIIRQMDIFKLLKVKPNNEHEFVIKQLEVQGRIIIHWFIIFCLVSVFGLILKRTSNRKNDNKDLIVVFSFGLYFALNKAFILEGILKKNILLSYVYYIHLFFLACLFVFFIFKSDRKNCV